MHPEVKTLKIDRTKLLTPQNYAITRGVHVSTVYRWINDFQVKTETIDGIVFVKIE